MAKQTGIHQIKGRVGEMSYYRQKGVSNGLLRSINPGMSERVKTSAEYENTRLNASEFGSAGSMAGATLRSVSKKWRYILDPFATGKLGRDVLALIKQDSTNPWGERVLTGTAWQDKVREMAQNYVKNPFEEFFDVELEITQEKPIGGDSKTLRINGDMSSTSLQKLAALGAEGISVHAFCQEVKSPVYDDASGKYTAASSNVIYVSFNDYEIGQRGMINLGRTLDDEWPTDASGVMSNVLFVVLPYKVIGNVKYILQNLCTCKFFKTPELSE